MWHGVGVILAINMILGSLLEDMALWGVSGAVSASREHYLGAASALEHLIVREGEVQSFVSCQNETCSYYIVM